MPLGLTPPPTAPSLSDPSTFAARADAFVAWFDTFITEWDLLSASQFFAVLGTVSQSGGVPTGAIMEEGSNANGEYVRFADGTQICRVNSLALAYNTSANCQSDWTYPAAFTAAPSLCTNIMNSATSGNVTPALDELLAPRWTNSGANSTIGRILCHRVNGGTSFVSGDEVTIMATAIGRWF
jgi:hypothetical protein